MVSKGDLGISYLIAVGVVLFATLSTGVTVPRFVSDIAVAHQSLVPAVSGFTIAVVFTTTGLWLRQSDLEDEMGWRVASWAAIGLGVPTVVLFVLYFWDPSALRGLDWRSLATMNIAFGGIIGILSGALVGLRTEYARKQTLYQRNTVFLRLFRHDIRNSVNLIQGHVDLLTSDHDLPRASVGVIDEQLDHILRLGTAAHRLDELDATEETRPIDLSSLVEDRLAVVRRDHPDVVFETDLDSETYVPGNDLLETAVDNLLTNPAVHHDGSVEVRVRVDRSAEGPRDVELCVRDDGPGFPEDEIAVHDRATETQLQHSDGVGLWLTRWIVESFDGTLSIGNHEDGGATVRVRLPSASPD
ncbi:Signal transduction histidine kinase, contains PAS domain [Halanaeroarchaeum sp. HSR-CO]|uniref:sensor histidine kinase n=1 Tax=Halanaeroarchaeum sp. HSR-CO TaxID=2866382 RepID=UPI00217F187A|nr:HAMP domain-containing sensor histidine kinase [Halanaeroarchaeum sp. HSR-CO]UWG46599.1 Signal transduction histidine kinase, contains PAS domain [Halanaeroarchaeum sp. HSR-CO]